MRTAGDLEGGEGVNILRTVGMAFALYSRIPMPRLDWESESRKYTLYAFPLVGFAVGICELLWLWIAQVLDLHTILTGAVLTALPIWVTGGIHLDGFCDVCDARASHQSRERKLEILKSSLPSCPEVTLVFFVGDAKKEGGEYQTVRGRIKKIDPCGRVIVLADQRRIPVDHILDIRGSSPLQ